MLFCNLFFSSFPPNDGNKFWLDDITFYDTEFFLV